LGFGTVKTVIARLFTFVSALSLVVAANAQYNQINIVSDGSVPALQTDASLVNPWGLAASATSPIWIANNASDTSGVYSKTGSKLLSVGVNGGPTGIVFNSAGGFSGSHFIFDSLDGNVYGWPGGANANLLFGVAGASFTGLAILGSNIYAADQNSNNIDVFNSAGFVSSFSDPTLAGSGYTPFNVQAVGSNLYVTYGGAMVGGYVDEFSATGTLLRRFASQGMLDCPWGIALAPSNFGQFSGDLLVGNNDAAGWINAFNVTTGAYVGTLMHNGSAISDNGLWGLEFGNGGSAGPTNTLYLTAGANDVNGLYASINAVPEPAPVVGLTLGVLGIGFLRRRRG